MKTFGNRINIHMRKNTVPLLGQKYVLSLLYFCLPNFRHLHPTFVSKASIFSLLREF